MFTGLADKAKKSAKKKMARKEFKNQVQIVAKKRGVNRKKAEQLLQDAKERLGISFDDYIKYAFYNVDPSDQMKEYKKIRRAERRRKARNQCIELAMKTRGWTKKEAIADLNDARKRTGVTYKEYRRYYFFDIPQEKQMGFLEDVRAGGEIKRQVATDKRRHFYEVISEETGWDSDRIHSEIKKAREICGASVKDYYALRLWQIPSDTWKEYFTSTLSKQIYSFYNTNVFYKDLIMNKEASNRFFNQFLHREWAINKDMSLNEFEEKFSTKGKVIYKPLNGKGGIDVAVYDFNSDNIDKVYSEIKSLRRGVVEEYIVQHPKMAKLYPYAVNTIRVVTVSRSLNGNPSNKVFFDVCYAAVRVGRNRAIVDNASSGGMVAGIDKNTGRIATYATTIDSETFEEHPDTHVKFKGFEIPQFQDVLKMVREAGELIDGYIGWDVAISENGPVLIEANSLPGNRILETPYVCETPRHGHRYVMQKYLDEIEDAKNAF